MVIVFGRCVFLKERFEDTNGLLEDLNRRKTDDIVAKRKRTKGQTVIYKTLHRKLKIG
jgi:hypothetical protein